LGGAYDFTNCTFYNSGSVYLDHQKETVLLSDLLYDQNQNQLYAAPLNAHFKNCVVSGSLDKEIAFSKAGTSYTCTFDYSLFKGTTDTINAYTTNSNCIFFTKDSSATLFKAPDAGNFAPDTLYPRILNTGHDYGLPSDLFCNPRNVNGVDMGAVERQY
jgi:hypothetical protein